MANEFTFGRPAIPSYRFDKAEVIVGFNADFLGSWLSPVEFAKQYAETRELSGEKKSMSKHYQFESTMSLTGTNADVRHSIKPSDELTVLLNLYNKIATKSEMPAYETEQSPVDVEAVANDLLHHQGKGLVVSGTNDVYIQALVNAINFLLGNLGGTFNFEKTLNTKLGSDQAYEGLIEQMENGEVAALVMNNVNPEYDSPSADKFKTALAKVGFSVAISYYMDETAQLATYVCPDHHYLESWNDAEAYTGMYTLAQPTIHPLFDTRQMQDSFMKWAGLEGDYNSYIKKYWENNLLAKQNKYLTFTDFWNHSLQDGVVDIE